MMPAIATPSFDGAGGSSTGCAMGAELRRRFTNLDAYERLTAPVLQMDPIARDVCMAPGTGRLLESGGAHVVPEVLRDYFAPVTPGAVYQDVVCLLHPERATRTQEEFSASLDSRFRKAEGRLQARDAFLDAFAAVLGVQNASFRPPASETRRLFGRRVSADGGISRWRRTRREK